MTQNVTGTWSAGDNVRPGESPTQDVEAHPVWDALTRRDAEALGSALQTRGLPSGPPWPGVGGPLAVAACSGWLPGLAMLMQAGTPIDAPGLRGWTPLMLACWHHHAPLVAHLLDAGARWDLRDADGWSAADHARASEAVDCLRLLEEAAARPVSVAVTLQPEAPIAPPAPEPEPLPLVPVSGQEDDAQRLPYLHTQAIALSPLSGTADRFAERPRTSRGHSGNWEAVPTGSDSFAESPSLTGPAAHPAASPTPFDDHDVPDPHAFESVPDSWRRQTPLDAEAPAQPWPEALRSDLHGCEQQLILLRHHLLIGAGRWGHDAPSLGLLGLRLADALVGPLQQIDRLRGGLTSLRDPREITERNVPLLENGRAPAPHEVLEAWSRLHHQLGALVLQVDSHGLDADAEVLREVRRQMGRLHQSLRDAAVLADEPTAL
jgi:hypothetical protein